MLPSAPLVAQQVAPPAPSLWPIFLFGLGVIGGLGLVYYRTYWGTSVGTLSRTGDAGSVYVLTNPQHEHLVKVGYTTRGARTRAKELSAATGVPGDFSVAFETHAPDPRAVEQAVHDRLSDHKVKRNREFFEVSPETARAAIQAEIGARASGPRRGLGLGLLAVALLGGFSLMTHPPAAPSLGPPASAWNLLNTGVETTGAKNLLGPPGAWGAALLVQYGLGYLSLLPLGVLGLAGVALVQRRPLGALVPPAALLLLATTATAAFIGEIGPSSSVPVGWNGRSPPSTDVSRWIGGGGWALIEWARALVGTGRALVLSGCAASLCVVLLGWWMR